jgi:hypothetical protein
VRNGVAIDRLVSGNGTGLCGGAIVKGDAHGGNVWGSADGRQRSALGDQRSTVGDVGEARHRRRILRISCRGHMDPDAWLDVYSGELGVGTEYVRVLDLLKIGQAVQIDVGLQKSSVGNLTGDLGELERFVGLI